MILEEFLVARRAEACEKNVQDSGKFSSLMQWAVHRFSIAHRWLICVEVIVYVSPSGRELVFQPQRRNR